MKFTKTKLNQLIRESLADYDGYGSPSDDDLEYLNTLPPKTSEKDLLANLSKEQKELAEDVLGWWAKQIDETGRLSGHTGKDGSVQRRLWSDEMLTNPPPGAEPVGLYICKLVFEALYSWKEWPDDHDPSLTLDWNNKGGDELIEKFKAILAGDDAAPEEQPEPGIPAGEKVDQRFAHLDIPSDESLATRAVKRYEEGQSIKLTKSKLHQLIREELANIAEFRSAPGLGDAPIDPSLDPQQQTRDDEPEMSRDEQAQIAAAQMLDAELRGNDPLRAFEDGNFTISHEDALAALPQARQDRDAREKRTHHLEEEKQPMIITKSKLKQLILEELEEATTGAGAGGGRHADELAALVGKKFGDRPDADDAAAAEQQPLTLATLGDILKDLAADQPEGSDIGDFVKAFLAKLSGG